MNDDIKNIKVNKIISHLIFRREDDGKLIEPHYSDDLIEMDYKMKATITERLSNALGKNSKSMEMKISKNGPESVFNNVKRILIEKDCIIINSKELAKRLAEVQTNKALPGGAVMVFQGTTGINNSHYVGIIKADKHNGFNIIEKPNKISLQLLSDLVLTPQNKLYKIALFILNNNELDDALSIEPEHFKAIVFDMNMSQGNMYQAAQYFYDSFLGLALTDNSKKLTYDFYQYTKSYINERKELTSEQKGDLTTALYTYLKTDNRSLVNFDEFAEHFFNTPQMKDDYRKFMTSMKIPNRAFAKNVELLSGALKKRKFRISNNVKIEVPSENIENKMKIIAETAEKTTIEFYGTIKEE